MRVIKHLGTDGGADAPYDDCGEVVFTDTTERESNRLSGFAEHVDRFARKGCGVGFGLPKDAALVVWVSASSKKGLKAAVDKIAAAARDFVRR